MANGNNGASHNYNGAGTAAADGGHTITALVQDKPGVLNRITNMFRRRGYNIASLAVGPSEIDSLSRMTFVVEGDPHTLEQVSKNLNKLIDVIKVVDVDDGNSVRRELALVRVRSDVHSRSEIIQIVSIFRANIIDVAPETLIVEVIGDEGKVDALVALLRPFGVSEVMRTGIVAMSRGMDAHHPYQHQRESGPARGAAARFENGSV